MAERTDMNDINVKMRRLESEILKERSRREAAETMAREAKEYADTIKEQVGLRINDVKQSLEVTISDLKEHIKVLKKQAEMDLDFYREKLGLANEKIVALLEGTYQDKPKPDPKPESSQTLSIKKNGNHQHDNGKKNQSSAPKSVQVETVQIKKPKKRTISSGSLTSKSRKPAEKKTPKTPNSKPDSE